MRKAMDFERAFVKAGGLADRRSRSNRQRRHRRWLWRSAPGRAAGRSRVSRQSKQSRSHHFNGAKFLGEDARIGSIAAGKQADLMVVKGNPAANITDIENVEIVFKDGVGYDSEKLIQSVQGLVGIR